MIRSVLFLGLEIFFIMNLVLMSYGIAAPQLSTSDPSTLDECNIIEERETIQNIDDNGVKTEQTEVGGTILRIPEGVSTTLEFDSSYNISTVSTSSVEKVSTHRYEISSGSASTFEYQISDLQGYPQNELIKTSNFTILPTSSSIGFDINQDRNPINRLYFTGDQFTSEQVDVGCQDILYFSPDNREIETHSEMLKHVSGSVPYSQNYSTLNVFIVEKIQRADNIEAEGLAKGNDMIITADGNNPKLFLHEYIHTRQSFTDLDADKQRPWYLEGSAQYYSTKLRYDAGFINRYEYLSEIDTFWKIRTSEDYRGAYEMEDPDVNHYAFGPRIFHEYYQLDSDKSIEEFYQNYESDGGICGDKICDAIVDYHVYIHPLHLNSPMIFYGTYGLVILGTIDTLRRRYGQIKSVLVDRKDSD